MTALDDLRRVMDGACANVYRDARRGQPVNLNSIVEKGEEAMRWHLKVMQNTIASMNDDPERYRDELADCLQEERIMQAALARCA